MHKLTKTRKVLSLEMLGNKSTNNYITNLISNLNVLMGLHENCSKLSSGVDEMSIFANL